MFNSKPLAKVQTENVVPISVEGSRQSRSQRADPRESIPESRSQLSVLDKTIYLMVFC